MVFAWLVVFFFVLFGREGIIMGIESFVEPVLQLFCVQLRDIISQKIAVVGKELMLVEDDVACCDHLVDDGVPDAEDVGGVVANKIANPGPGRKPSSLLGAFLGGPRHRERRVIANAASSRTPCSRTLCSRTL